MLGLIFDDTVAIMKTGLSGDYNIIFRSFITVVSTVIFSYIFYKLSVKISRIRIDSYKILTLFSLFSIYIIAVSLSSTLSLKGGSLDYVVKNLPKSDFLRKAVPGALRDIFVVYKSYKNMDKGVFEDFSNGKSPKEVVAEYTSNSQYLNDNIIDINNILKKQVDFGTYSNIEHIFVIIGESLSDYHFDDEFNEIGLMSGLKEITSRQNSRKMPICIQSGHGTISTLDVVLTGLYAADVKANGIEPTVSDNIGNFKAFSTSNKVFKDLGYNTNFYYFGSPLWRNLDRYIPSQGFDKLYSIVDMVNAKRGVWGVYDGEGFNFILDNVNKNKDIPSFNMILTTGYHPPFDIPVAEYGAPVDKIQYFLDKNYPEEKRYTQMTANILSHAWYMDKSISHFVKEIEKNFSNFLIVITGDHFDRIHPNPIRNLKTSNTVPLIFYGKDIDKTKLKYSASSHIDIMASIVELVAKKGYEYYSFGKPLLTFNHNIETNSERIAIGYNTVANGRFISDGNHIEYFNGNNYEKDNELIEKAFNEKILGKALSWYIINKGYIISDE